MSTQLLLASSSPRRRSILNLANIDFITYSPQVDESAISNKLLEIYKGACQSAMGRIITGELALQKALAAAYLTKAPLILAADTLVMCRGYILGKPQDAAVAHSMFNLLLGKQLSSEDLALLGTPKATEEDRQHQIKGQYHQVSTGVCLLLHKNYYQNNLSPELSKSLKEVKTAYPELNEYYKLSFVEQAGVYMQGDTAFAQKTVDDYIAAGNCYDKAGAYAVQESTAALINGIVGDVYTVMGLPLHALLEQCSEILPLRAAEAITDAPEIKEVKVRTVAEETALKAESAPEPELINTNTRKSAFSRFNSALMHMNNKEKASNTLPASPTADGQLKQQSGTEKTPMVPDLSLSRPLIFDNSATAVGQVNSLQSKLQELRRNDSSLPSFLQKN